MLVFDFPHLISVLYNRLHFSIFKKRIKIIYEFLGNLLNKNCKFFYKENNELFLKIISFPLRNCIYLHFLNFL